MSHYQAIKCISIPQSVLTGWLITVGEMMLWMLLIQSIIRAVYMLLIAAFMLMAMKMKAKAIMEVLMAVLPRAMMSVQRSSFFRRQWHL
jgi:hypothetical protein